MCPRLRATVILRSRAPAAGYSVLHKTPEELGGTDGLICRLVCARGGPATALLSAMASAPRRGTADSASVTAANGGLSRMDNPAVATPATGTPAIDDGASLAQASAAGSTATAMAGAHGSPSLRTPPREPVATGLSVDATPASGILAVSKGMLTTPPTAGGAASFGQASVAGSFAQAAAPAGKKPSQAAVRGSSQAAPRGIARKGFMAGASPASGAQAVRARALTASPLAGDVGNSSTIVADAAFGEVTDPVSLTAASGGPSFKDGLADAVSASGSPAVGACALTASPSAGTASPADHTTATASDMGLPLPWVLSTRRRLSQEAAIPRPAC